MTDTLELPDGSRVEAGDVFLYNDYPYRYVPAERGDDQTADGRASPSPDRESSSDRESSPDRESSLDHESSPDHESTAAEGSERTAERVVGTTTAPADGEAPAFYLSPLYWGGGEMDVPFRDREALREQWEPDASGVLDDAGWEAWLAEARDDDQFGEAELDAVARELFDDSVPAPLGDRAAGLFDRLRALFS